MKSRSQFPRRSRQSGTPPAADVRATPQRRVLSHVGGAVKFQGGDAALRATLKSALSVESDEGATRKHVHGFHPYPARLHPDTAFRLIQGLSQAGDAVLDPFCGSGTALIEARLAGRLAIGTDANPLGVVLSRAKANPLVPRDRGLWLRAAHAVGKAADAARRERTEPHREATPEDQLRFGAAVFRELDSLWFHISAVQEEVTRGILSIVFSSILSKVSEFTADGTHRPRRSPLSSGQTIRIFRDRAVEFAKQSGEYAKLIPDGVADADVQVADARELRSIPDGSVDLIVTSPPYPGVYDYHAQHQYALRWLGLPHEDFGRVELGAKRQLSGLSQRDALACWQRDLSAVMRTLSRVLRPGGRACLVLADTALAGAVFLADEQVVAAANAAGLGVVGVASQSRPSFYRPSRDAFAGGHRREHLVVLRAN